MKRILSGILALMLAMGMAASASAEKLMSVSEERFANVRNLVTVGDTLYILTNRGTTAALHRWQSGMPEVKTIVEDLCYADFYYSTEDVTAAMKELGLTGDPRHAVSQIFTDGSKLYGFNRLEKLIFTIEETADGLKYADVATLPLDRLGSYRTPQMLILSGKWLLWMDTDNNTRNRTERLLAFDLEKGTVKQAILPDLVAALQYRDGKILAICDPRDQNKKEGLCVVSAYDPETDAVDLLGYLPDTVTANCVDYHAGMDRIVYRDMTRVMGWSPDKGETQLGFVPLTYTREIAAAGESLAAWNNDVLHAVPLSEDFSSAHSLTLMDMSASEAVRAFHEKHPDVPYYFSNNRSVPENYADILTMGEGAPDVISFTYSAFDYPALVDSGCLMDLSGNAEIKAHVDALYPLYQDVVTRDGAIYGVPLFANGYDGWFINKAVMKDMGLTPEEIPTSLTEMCAFATRWNEEFAEKYPHYTLLNNTENYRKRLLEAILERWYAVCTLEGKPLDVSDPALQEALAALDAAKLDKLDASLKQTNPEVSEYKQALIWTGIKVVGNWGTYMEESSDRIFIPLTLTKDTPFTAAVQRLTILGVNAATKEPDLAAEMLAEQLVWLDPAQECILRTDRTEPFMSDYNASLLELDRKEIAALEERLEESVDREAIEARIAESKAKLAEKERTIYTVSPSAIENYVKVIQPGSFISQPNAVVSPYTERLYTAIWDYAEERIAMAQFLEELTIDLNTERTPETELVPSGGNG